MIYIQKELSFEKWIHLSTIKNCIWPNLNNWLNLRSEDKCTFWLSDPVKSNQLLNKHNNWTLTQIFLSASKWRRDCLSNEKPKNECSQASKHVTFCKTLAFTSAVYFSSFIQVSLALYTCDCYTVTRLLYLTTCSFILNTS